MTIDWSQIVVSVVGNLPFIWYLGSSIGSLRAKVEYLEGELERKAPSDVGSKFAALERDLDTLRQSVLSGFIVKNPESDVARGELRTMHREAKALYSVSTEECLKVTERIERFEDAHQSLIDRFQAVLRREEDDPIMLNHAAVAACKRLEIYANESFLDVRRQAIWLKQKFEESKSDLDGRIMRLDVGLKVTAEDIESLQERVGILEGTDGQ